MAQTQTRMKWERERESERQRGKERKGKTKKKNINLHNVSADAPVFWILRMWCRTVHMLPLEILCKVNNENINLNIIANIIYIISMREMCFGILKMNIYLAYIVVIDQTTFHTHTHITYKSYKSKYSELKSSK